MIALILHGWPQFNIRDHFLVKHLEKKGYEVLTPNLFKSDEIFHPSTLLTEINKLIKGRDLDVIIGISLGGLIAPYIAREYPNAKLIFIASGSRLRSNNQFFSFLISFSRSIAGRWLLPVIVKMPTRFLQFWYRLINPGAGNFEEKRTYEQDMATNIDSIKRIPIKKEIEILDFVSQIDNESLLKTLTNPALIIGGQKDAVMGQDRSYELHRLLVNSEVIVSQGSHFNVITENNLDAVDKFLL